MLALENEFQGKLEFVVADVDDPQGQQLAGRYSVNAIPAFFILDAKGNIAYQEVGVVDKETLAKNIKDVLNK